MRNCFTKITNVFRKKPIQQDQPEQNRLNGEEYSQSHRICEDDNGENSITKTTTIKTAAFTATTTTTTTPKSTTIKCIIVNECSATNDFDKQQRNNNNNDYYQQQHHHQNDDKEGDNDDEDDDINFTEHREISNSVVDKQKKATNMTTNKTTSSLERIAIANNVKQYNNSSQKTNKIYINENALELTEINNSLINKNSINPSQQINVEGLHNITIRNNETETDRFLQQVETATNQTRLSEAKKENHQKQQLQGKYSNSQITEVSKGYNNNTSTCESSTSSKQSSHTYIQEYKSFVEDNRRSLINSPLPLSLPPDIDLFATDEILKRPSTINTNLRHSIERDLLKLPKVLSRPSSTPPNVVDTGNVSIVVNTEVIEAKTPEEIEYEAKVAAESEDVMTPLPTDTQTKQLAFGVGRNLQPEIVEVIRNLDANTLRINNLTVDDKVELLRRYEGKYQNRRHSRGNNNVRFMTTTETNNQTVQQQLQPLQSQDDSSDSDYGDVVLRRKVPSTLKVDHSRSNLYERRQPKGPKLKLILENKKPNTSNETNSITLCKMPGNETEVRYWAYLQILT